MERLVFVFLAGCGFTEATYIIAVKSHEALSAPQVEKSI